LIAWSVRDVLAYLERVEKASGELDHFDLLDVGAGATDAEIQSAFHRVAGGIHPDRHRNRLTAEQLERLTVVYARIAEAYRVLRDPEARDTYLRSMARRRKAGTAPPPTAPVSMLSPKAQRLYRRAQASLRTGDKTSAMLNLKMALRLHPTSDLLREALRRAKS
jgi:curved DNA-binding protein CbpA